MAQDRPGGADKTTATQGVPAVDVAVLKALIGDDPATVHGLLFDYRASARQFAIALRAAHAADDVRQIGAIAHQLKSSSRAVEALSLGDLCAELENACRTRAGEAVSRGMARFEIEHRVVDDGLGRLLARAV